MCLNKKYELSKKKRRELQLIKENMVLNVEKQEFGLPT